MSAGHVHKYTSNPERDDLLLRSGAKVRAVHGEYGDVAATIDRALTVYADLRSSSVPDVALRANEVAVMPVTVTVHLPTDGALMRKARLAAGWSLGELARHLTSDEDRHTHQRIARMERDEVPLSLAALTWLGPVQPEPS